MASVCIVNIEHIQSEKEQQKLLSEDNVERQEALSAFWPIRFDSRV